MSLVTRKPVFRVFDQVRLKQVSSVKEASKSHEIANIDTRDIILSRQRTTKVCRLICAFVVRIWHKGLTIWSSGLGGVCVGGGAGGWVFI